MSYRLTIFFFQAEDGIRDVAVTGVQTCALPIFLHPHHVPLLERPRNLRSIIAHSADDPLFYDPYYAIDGHAHRNVLAPRFDVVETPTAYLLEGEVAGMIHKSDVSVEWLENRTLIVRGRIPQRDPEREWDLK